MGLWDDVKSGVGKALGRAGDAVFGKKSGVALPDAYKAGNVVGGAQGHMASGGIAAAGRGEGAVGDVLSRQKAGLGGYTGAQERAMFQRESDRVRAEQAKGSQMARQQAVAGGLGGGFAAKMQGRLAGQAQQQQADLGRDLSLKNIDEQQRRLQNYAQTGAGFNQMDMNRRAFAMQSAQQQEANKQAEWQMNMQRYGMKPEKKGGGIAGALAEKALPGIGGSLYSGFRYG